MAEQESTDNRPFWLALLTDSRRFRLLAILVLIGGAVWLSLSRPQAAQVAPRPAESPQVGFTAPDFSLASLDGGVVSLSDLRGQVVLVNLWTSWCPPCRAEMPAIERVYQKHRAAGFVVLGVNATNQDSEDEARSFAQSQGLSFPILLDRTGLVGMSYRLRSLPTTYFVGRDGIIRDIVIGGPMSEASIEAKIKRLLAEGL